MRCTLFALLVLYFISCHNKFQDATLVITNTNIIDPVHQKIIPGQTILIKDSIIVGIVSGGLSQINLADSLVIDGTGKYIISGFWNMHTHVCWKDNLNETVLPVLLSYGITGVRDMGGDMTVMNHFKKKILQNPLSGPIIYGQKENEFNIPEKDTVTKIEVLYRSENNGKTWFPFSNGIPENATVSGLAAKPNKIFAVTVADGAFVWERGSIKWEPINNGLPESIHLNAIAVAENVLVTGTLKQGIFVSSDEGNTWKPSGRGLENISVRAFIFIRDTLLAGTDKGIYISSDKGKTWKHVFRSTQVNGFTTLNEKIYAAAANGAIMTKNPGNDWEYIYKRHTLHDISNDGQYIYAMTLGEGLLKTNNEGLNWQNANTGFGPVNFYTFEVKNMNRDLFAAQWHGIYHSDNQGRYWSKVNTGHNGLPDSTAFTTLEVTDFGMLAGTGLK